MAIEKNPKIKFRIMVVEDSPSTRELYRAEIGDSHFVEFFEDARSALLHYQSFVYDLVITDLMLPFKSGEGFVYDLRYINPHQKIAVVSGAVSTLRLEPIKNVNVFKKPVDIVSVINFVLLGEKMESRPPQGLSRRKNPRYEIDLTAALVIPEKRPVKIFNMSLSGLFVEIPGVETLPSGSLVIEIPLANEIIALETIKRWESNNWTIVPVLGVGVEFQNLDHTQYSMLELYLESLNYPGKG